MQAEALETYSDWDLAFSPLPARSHLYCLEPIAVGTGMVESLSSYVARLAEAHCVTSSELLTRQVALRLRKIERSELPMGVSIQSALATLTLQQEVVRRVNAVDWVAPTKVVASKVKVLEQLTSQKNLSQVTWMPLDKQFLFKNALHVHQPWCPECYRDWHDADQPIYDPLLWSLNLIVICPRHQKRLRFACPTCDRAQPFLKLTTKPGYCNYCGTWLGRGSNFPSDSDFKDSDLWIAQAISSILAVMPNLKSQPRPRKRLSYTNL